MFFFLGACKMRSPPFDPLDHNTHEPRADLQKIIMTIIIIFIYIYLPILLQ